MPYTNEYRPAELFLRYKDLSIYHVYKNDDPSQGVREYWFDTQEDSRDDNAFDVRDIANKLERIGFTNVDQNIDDDSIKRFLMRQAIDVNLIRTSK